MKASTFDATLTDLYGPSEPYNTNNGWGFGGGVGKRWRSPDGKTFKRGKASFRHLKPQPYITVTKDGRRIFDEDDTPRNRKVAITLTEL